MSKIQKIIDEFNQDRKIEVYNELHAACLDEKEWLEYANEKFCVKNIKTIFTPNSLGAGDWFTQGKVNYLKTLQKNLKFEKTDAQIIIYSELGRKTYTNQEFLWTLTGVINKLKDQGVKEKSQVLFFFKDKELSLFYAFACLSLNATYGFLFEGFAENYITEIVNVVNPDHVFFDHDYPKVFDESKMLKADMTLVNPSLDDINKYEVDTNYPSVIYLTSGTTAIPKIVYTGAFSNMVSGCINAPLMFTPQRNNSRYTIYNNLNPAWGASTLMGFYGTLFSGNRLVLDSDMQSMINGEIEKKIINDNIDTIISVPVFFAKRELEQKIPIKHITFTGEKLTSESLAKINSSFDLGKTVVINVYGQIEFSGPIGHSYPNKTLNEDNLNLLTAFPGVQVHCDKEGNIILNNKYPSICKSISKSKEIYASYWDENNDYKTKDLGKMNGENQFYLLGRNDGLIKRKGRYVDLALIESEISKIIKISAKSVITNENYDFVIFYESKKDMTLELSNLISTRHGRHALPVKFIKLDEFPRNYNGKIDEKTLKKLAEE